MMNIQCAYCRRQVRTIKDHNQACPDHYGSKDPRRKICLAGYSLGWYAGRSGDAPERTFKPGGNGIGVDAWELGATNGTIALEEYENSDPPDYD